MLHVQLQGIPEGECWLASLIPLGNGSLGPLLQLHAQSLGPPHPCRPPMWAPRPYRPPSLSPSTMASGGQLVDVSQRKAPQFSAWPSPWMAHWIWPFQMLPYGHASAPSFLCAGGPGVGLPPWQCAEHRVSASWSPLQREAASQGVATGSAASELTGDSPDLHSSLFLLSSGPQFLSAQGLKV